MITRYQEKKQLKRDEWGAWNVMKAKAVGQYSSPSIIYQLFEFHGKSLLLVLPYCNNWLRCKQIIQLIWDNTQKGWRNDIKGMEKRKDRLLSDLRVIERDIDYEGGKYNECDLDDCYNAIHEIFAEIREHNRYFGPTYRHLVKSKALPRYRPVANMFDDYGDRYQCLPDDIDEVLEYLLQFDTSTSGNEYMKTVGALLGISIH